MKIGTRKSCLAADRNCDATEDAIIDAAGIIIVFALRKNGRTTTLFVNFVLKGVFGVLTIKQLCFFAIQKERNLKIKIET